MNTRSRRHFLTILGCSAILSPRLSACLWDTDTLRDELLSQSTIFDLITGQFPHHGDAYYKKRLTRLKKEGKRDIVGFNDMAVAHVRLEDFTAAEVYLEKALKLNPRHYETLSNIGVTAKKRGDFEKGAKYIAKALAIKPEGHMGLGDWYLRALRWRSQFEAAENPSRNFLGRKYKDLEMKAYGILRGKYRRTMDLNKRREIIMVKNDQTFADGFLVLGDFLFEADQLNLSFLAHTKAMTLGHQHSAEIQRRRKAYLTYNRTFPRGYKPEKIKPWEKGVERAEAMLNNGQAWLEEFKETEASLLKHKTSEKEVSFMDVLRQMAHMGIKKQQFL